MAHLKPKANYQSPTGKPGTVMLAILGGAGLLLLFFIAWLVVAAGGKKVLPGGQHDPEPYSYVAPQAGSARYV